jgi:hypothetical protein
MEKDKFLAVYKTKKRIFYLFLYPKVYVILKWNLFGMFLTYIYSADWFWWKKPVKLTGLWPRVHEEYKFSDRLICFISSMT